MHFHRNISEYLLMMVMVIISLLMHFSTSYASPWEYGTLLSDMASRPTEDVIKSAEKEETSGNREKALVLYMMVCNRDTLNMPDTEKEMCSYAYFRAGYLHYEAGRFSKALEFHINGLKLCETTERHRYAANFYKDLGIIYSVYNDFEKGLHYMRKGVEALKENPDPDTEYKLLTSIFFNNISLNDIPGARETAEALSDVNHLPTDTTRYMDGYIAAILKYADGRYHEAAEDLNTLASFAESKGIGAQYQCHAYQSLYNCYRMTGEQDSIFKYATLCKNLSDSCGIRHKFAAVLLALSDYYGHKGNARESQRYKADYYTTMDSIFNSREFDAVKNLQDIYEMDKVDSEIRTLNARQREKETTIYYLKWIIAITSVAVIAVTVLLIWVYRQKRNLDESYINLYNMNRRLTRALEKDKDEEKTRYTGSNLTEEMNEKLLHAINNVMENTSEYCSETFTLDRLAELVESNPKYVSQAINGNFGKNFSNFVNEYRIRTACARLADFDNFSTHTINAIGQSVGFKSNTTFTAVFKKFTGMTPSVYQKIARTAPDGDAQK